MNRTDYNNINTQLAAFAARHMVVILLGHPNEENPNNGTISLVEINGRKFGITCDHVISKYYELQSSENGVRAQIGYNNVNIDDIIIDRNPTIDLATLDFENVDININYGNSDVKVSFFSVPRWPPAEVRLDDRLYLGGFPGLYRFTDGSRLMFRTLTVDAHRIHRIEESRITCQFSRDQWRYHVSTELEPPPQALGGVSGGPVFMFHGLTNESIVYPEFVGVLTQQHVDYDIVYINKCHFINSDGTITLRL